MQVEASVLGMMEPRNATPELGAPWQLAEAEAAKPAHLPPALRELWEALFAAQCAGAAAEVALARQARPERLQVWLTREGPSLRSPFDGPGASPESEPCS